MISLNFATGTIYPIELTRALRALGTNLVQGPSPQEQELLNQLIDIQLPERIGFWPPSIALLTLFVLAISILFFSIYIFARHKARNKYRKLAMLEFEALVRNRTKITRGNLFLEVNTLLKRVSITATPKSKPFIAGMWGREYYAFLNSTMAKQKISDVGKFNKLVDAWNKYHFEQTPDQGETDIDTISSYVDFARAWIKFHKVDLIKLAMNTNQTQTNELAANKRPLGVKP